MSIKDQVAEALGLYSIALSIYLVCNQDGQVFVAVALQGKFIECGGLSNTVAFFKIVLAVQSPLLFHSDFRIFFLVL